MHEVHVHLGAWPEDDALAGVLASASEGRLDRLPDSDEINERLVERYRDASREEVIDSLVRARDNAAADFDDPDTALDSALAGSVVGPLPVLSVVVGGNYQLAVQALDLEPAGARPPSDHLLLTGLGALAEVTSALAAGVGLNESASLHSPDRSAAGVSPPMTGRGRQPRSGPSGRPAPPLTGTPPACSTSWPDVSTRSSPSPRGTCACTT